MAVIFVISPNLVTLGARTSQNYCNRNVAQQSRLNVFGGPGPARLMGPLSSLWPTWRGGAVVLCTSESGNTHLGLNQGQT